MGLAAWPGGRKTFARNKKETVEDRCGRVLGDAKDTAAVCSPLRPNVCRPAVSDSRPARAQAAQERHAAALAAAHSPPKRSSRRSAPPVNTEHEPRSKRQRLQPETGGQHEESQPFDQAR